MARQRGGLSQAALHTRLSRWSRIKAIIGTSSSRRPEHLSEHGVRSLLRWCLIFGLSESLAFLLHASFLLSWLAEVTERTLRTVAAAFCMYKSTRPAGSKMVLCRAKRRISCLAQFRFRESVGETKDWSLSGWRHSLKLWLHFCSEDRWLRRWGKYWWPLCF